MGVVSMVALGTKAKRIGLQHRALISRPLKPSSSVFDTNLIDPNLDPTINPTLDLTLDTKQATT
jgi:hypothetical protein